MPFSRPDVVRQARPVFLAAPAARRASPHARIALRGDVLAEPHREIGLPPALFSPEICTGSSSAESGGSRESVFLVRDNISLFG